MASSLTIAAYLAGLGAQHRPTGTVAPPPRPDGTVLWVRCSSRDQLNAVSSLNRKLTLEGDPLHLVTTVPELTRRDAHRALPQPVGRAETKEFLDYWRPKMSIWVGGDLDTRLLAELRDAGVRNMMVDATAEGLDKIVGRWVPGALRSLLTQFEAILALDHANAEKLVRAGANKDSTIVTGAMEDCGPVLPYSETERSEVLQILGTRPVWLAANAHPDEALALAHAQREASRRAHRLVMIAVPRLQQHTEPLHNAFKAAGMNVALRSEVDQLNDATQIYLVDTEEELGLWYRIAPVSYIGGTLQGTGCSDPFEATTLGSAVVYGPQVAPYQKNANRLNAAGGAVLIRAADDLGPAIEMLLSPDKAAAQAHTAWDVVTQGANVTNRIATYIQLRLEELAV
ncbi:3-deoxy-D-manno-octulosonic acid transferase [Yoonia litorea]|uniref:3-deoxy-D-manno-octulosonic acid transferase n=1 Tax=Yoonia litorea TaxID=1123755 RepID=A0A1I6MWR8_9RHOB|nr:glycosyltransferase N-terminal domain-containing protein [Yoonia litorea]SFS20146.1 3-deoxy-D-manno-octulosonic-acid transferase [Yoonia litorea]